MPRANRYFVPGYIWHITHRCHKKEFLLKFKKDRNVYLAWLFRAKKRYGTLVLNYMITSNHVHILVLDSGKKGVLPRSIQLVAGRMAQEYNQRKNRRGAFWEDRYHATAIDSDAHLNECMTYIDMNMVRAGVVSHPKDWPHCGYYELLAEKKRYTILDTQSLLDLFFLRSLAELTESRRFYVEEAVDKNKYICRDEKYTESVAVGSASFIEKIKMACGSKAIGRKIEKEEQSYFLRDTQTAYKPYFRQKKGV